MGWLIKQFTGPISLVVAGMLLAIVVILLIKIHGFVPRFIFGGGLKGEIVELREDNAELDKAINDPVTGWIVKLGAVAANRDALQGRIVQLNVELIEARARAQEAEANAAQGARALLEMSNAERDRILDDPDTGPDALNVWIAEVFLQ